MKINEVLAKVGKSINKNSPQILLGTGIAGFIGSIILTAKAAPEAKRRVEVLHDELGKSDKELSKHEIIFEEFKVAAPCYIPTIVTAAASTGCILGSYKISSTRTAALAAAYELAQTGIKEYKEKVKEVVGEQKEAKIRHEIAQDKVNKSENVPPMQQNRGNEVMMTDGMTLFYDCYGGRYFRSSVNEVRKAEKYIADRLISEMYVEMNEFYYQLGLPNTKFGDMMGFNVDDGIEINLNSCVAPNDEPCMVLDFCAGPRPDAQRFY